jgi:hypothetical protein
MVITVLDSNDLSAIIWLHSTSSTYVHDRDLCKYSSLLPLCIPSFGNNGYVNRVLGHTLESLSRRGREAE